MLGGGNVYGSGFVASSVPYSASVSCSIRSPLTSLSGSIRNLITQTTGRFSLKTLRLQSAVHSFRRRRTSPLSFIRRAMGSERQIRCVESQRDSGLQPKVARDELPWVPESNGSQPQRGCVSVHLTPDKTPLGFEWFSLVNPG